jgi:putative selenate reductase molybdopterin-binding subunit
VRSVDEWIRIGAKSGPAHHDVINPMQARGQIDGAIAMGFGWALYEKMVFDANGAILNPALRDYRIPAFADVPRSEIYFADTHDKVGPLGAKAQGECAINCVAPAIANAIANATGVRFPSLPLTPDRLFQMLASPKPRVPARVPTVNSIPLA